MFGFSAYRKFKHPSGPVCRVGGGRTSAGLVAEGRLCVGFRPLGAVPLRRPWPIPADSRQRAESKPAGSWPHRIGLRFRLGLCGRRGVTRPQRAVRALPAGSAPAPARTAACAREHGVHSSARQAALAGPEEIAARPADRHPTQGAHRAGPQRAGSGEGSAVPQSLAGISQPRHAGKQNPRLSAGVFLLRCCSWRWIRNPCRPCHPYRHRRRPWPARLSSALRPPLLRW